MLFKKQIHLSSFYAIEGLNRHLLAREARRAGGQGLLFQGDISEKLQEDCRSYSNSVCIV